MIERNKLLIIGLDGAPYIKTKRWIEEGKLPTLRKLKEKGFFGLLKSTIPPISPTAWATFLTGKDPSKHGILDFTTNGKPFMGSSIVGPSFVDILDQEGQKTLTINLPMTYPPKELENGIMISGFPLLEDGNYVHPSSIQEELESHGWFLNDIPTQAFSEKYFDQFIDELNEKMDKRFQAFEYLNENYEWDVAILHILETDKIQHDFWIYDEKKNSKYSGTMLDFFQKIDTKLSQLLNKLNEKTLDILVVSDHGFAKSPYFIQLNKLLSDKGYLKYKRNWSLPIKNFFYKFGLNPINIVKVIPRRLFVGTVENEAMKYHRDKIGVKERIFQGLLRLLKQLFITERDFDLESSDALAFGNSGIGQIRLLNRDSKKRIIKDLEDLEDPQTSKKIVDRVYEADEIYQGEFKDEAADILVEFSDYSYTALANDILLSSSFVGINHFAAGAASHHPDGIILGAGPDFSNRKGVIKARLRDLCPTILMLRGCPMPEDVDGNVVDGVLGEHVIRNKRKSKAYKHTEKKECIKYTREDEEKIKSRLRDMGYL